MDPFVCQVDLTRLNLRHNIRKQTTLSLQAMAVKDTVGDISDGVGCGYHRYHKWCPPTINTGWKAVLHTSEKTQTEHIGHVALLLIYGKGWTQGLLAFPPSYLLKTGNGIERIVLLTTLVNTMYSTAPCSSMLKYQSYLWQRSRNSLAKAEPFSIQATSLKGHCTLQQRENILKAAAKQGEINSCFAVFEDMCMS